MKLLVILVLVLNCTVQNIDVNDYSYQGKSGYIVRKIQKSECVSKSDIISERKKKLIMELEENQRKPKI